MSQPKAKLMARLRARRRAAGLVRVEFWLWPEQAERVKRYVARIARASDEAAVVQAGVTSVSGDGSKK